MRRVRSWRRHRRVLIAAAVSAAGFVLVLGPRSDPPDRVEPAQRPSSVSEPSTGDDAGDADASPDGPDTTGAGEATTAGPGPRSSVGGVGVGFEHSERGAIAAGMSYATAAQSWLYLGDEQLIPAAEAVVAPDARARLVGPLVEDVRLLRDELQDTTGVAWYVVSPLATRLDSYSDERAAVSVWIVRVLSADGVAVPQSGWRTLTFDLVWDSSDWRVADVTETEGPTPQLEAGAQPWAAPYLDETLTGFVRVGVAP